MLSRPQRWAACLCGLALLGAGCGSSAAPAPTPTVPAASQSPAGLQLTVASSELAVGPNRFTFGLLDNNHPLEIGTPRLTFFSVRGRSATTETSAVAHFNYFSSGLKDTAANSAAMEIKGVYVAQVRFNRPGSWGVDVRLRYKGRVQDLRQGFQVAARSLTPAVGTPAPRSNNPTTAQMPATLLDSGRPPDDMHKLSIAQAIAQRKPLVVLFATAAYCTSRLCGPEIEVVQGIERRFQPRVNFVHIEIYRKANPQYGYAPTVLQWRLQTEPWVFVVNRRGIITAKFEGPTTAEEIVPAITAALRG